MQMMRLLAGDVVAEMCNAPRSGNLGQDESVARLKPAPIVVLPGGVGGGNTMKLEAMECGQAVQSDILGLGKQTGAQLKSEIHDHPQGAIAHTQRKSGTEGSSDLKSLQRKFDSLSLAPNPRILRQSAVLEPDAADIAPPQAMRPRSWEMVILPRIQPRLVKNKQGVITEM